MSENLRGALINYEVYLDSNRMLGTATIDLPDLKFLTADISGAGVAGKLDFPILGHTDSLEVTLNWRTINTDVMKLGKQTGLDLALYGANQNIDNSTGESSVEQVKISLRGIDKTSTLGKFEPASSTETKSVLEVFYIKIEIDGTKVLELDKLNFVYYVDDNDYLEDVATALGITDGAIIISAGFTTSDEPPEENP